MTVRIAPEAVELLLIRLPLVEPFETSFGRTDVREILLVRVLQDGCEGWGECVTDYAPLYSSECNGTARYVMETFLIPALFGDPLRRVSDWPRRVAFVKGHPMAKAALEMALWDLYGQMVGRSLRDLWGGTKDLVPVGVSVGIHPDVPSLLRTVERYRAEGYQRVKLKIKPGRDHEVLAAVRGAFPDALLTADANAAYRWPRDRAVLVSMDAYRLQMLEQPFPPDDWLGHARLQRALQTPICLDESVTSLATLRLALRLRAGQVINIKPGRVGGYTVARRIHDVCRRRGVPVWCGGMLETGIGRAANVALASLPGFVLPNDLSASRRYWVEDIVEPPFELQPGGYLAVPTGPGLGVRVVRTRLPVQWSQTYRRDGEIRK